MLIIMMMKFKYLATLRSVETHLSFITQDYVSLLNVTFNIHAERIKNLMKWKVSGLSFSCHFVQYLLVLFIETQGRINFVIC